ncbi:xanthine dehydrogenase accessory protein XdhC [Aliidongia dinghuensis]|uniref:Xanthine dehydrogenase accessory protein XdhC n=1 Tax=Aliidongia dinghuensis TaxID=1867774 RepID=A0A8J3E3E5_9PROT|nr:xanthine dehydrogenase accessory protein XdhC [Aliidongia dinghuensis]GGF05944.1 xanthine dehydrogenase accessory protein XdhC [Aliidongia dinghuensis]
MTDWIDALARLKTRRESAVLVTVVTANGSTPREAGCKMVVTADGLYGTIGGGHLEFRALEIARALLADPTVGSAGPVLKEFPLGPALGQCCGGAAGLLFEPVLPPGLVVALFGAGHVGRALAHVLGTLPCRVLWIDPRAAEFPPDVPGNVEMLVSALPVHEVERLPAGAQVLIMTHSHQLDLELVDAALKRTDFATVGLIGSATKRARFVKRLALRGHGLDTIRRLVCPIGVPGAGGKHPAEIAIAVAAQILQTDQAVRLAPAEKGAATASNGGIFG